MTALALIDTLCPACDGDHGPGCRAIRDAWWSIVKDRTDGHAYRWARTRLALDDEPETAPARQAPVGHVHGWARAYDDWRCIQDYYAAGERPDSGCGATWQDPNKAAAALLEMPA